MRVIVLFDLPTITEQDRRNYRLFRKHLIKSGFMILQESVYCKLALNATAAQAITTSLKMSKPPKGLVQVLVITERQFANMEIIVGECPTEVIDSDERLVVL